MILNIRIEPMKDKTKKVKRLMSVGLITDMKGLEKVNAIAELDSECVLGKEIDKLITDLVDLKTQENLKNSIKIVQKPKSKKKKSK